MGFLRLQKVEKIDKRKMIKYAEKLNYFRFFDLGI